MKRITFTLLVLIFVCACKKQDEEAINDSYYNAAQSATSEVGAHSSAVEGASSPLTLALDYIDPSDKKSPLLAACTFSGVRSACSSNAITLSWNNCTIASGKIILSGGWSEVFNSSTACSNFSSGGTLATNGDWITRTTNNSQATFLSGPSLTTDTNGGVAWDGTVMNTNGVRVTRTGAAARTINIDSVHRVLRGTLGTKWFDHFITGSLNVTGTRSAGNRVITSGTLSVYHNLAKYTASNSFSNVAWGSGGCCYPTSGSITTTLTGSATSTIIVDFTPGGVTCGNASYTVNGGSSQSFTLTQCM